MWDRLLFERRVITSVVYVSSRWRGCHCCLILIHCLCVCAPFLVRLVQTVAVTVALFTAYLNVIYGVRFTTAQNLQWMRSVLISIATGTWLAVCVSACVYLRVGS